MKNRTQTGFTLFELLTTVTIVGVVLAIGVPNMQSFRQNSRMIAAANDLHSSFHLARSEAARSKTNITICATADSTVAVPVCGGELEAGWVIFEDRDGDIVVDAAEPVLRRFPAIAGAIVVNTVGPDDYFSFASTGLGRGNILASPALSVMTLCDVRGNIRGGGGKSAARVLVVTPLGRASVLADEGQVTFHGGCP
jgi:type IV fimbrial biogenesis protein FimT